MGRGGATGGACKVMGWSVQWAGEGISVRGQKKRLDPVQGELRPERMKGTPERVGMTHGLDAFMYAVGCL